MNKRERIAALRKQMRQNKIDAFIIYSADPHMSEYLPEQWKERSWISGFTGSAGWVVILSDKAGLWTDGRYFTQAAAQLEGSGIDLFKMGIEGTPNYIDWIISETPENATVAVNALTTSNANWEEVSNKLEKNSKTLKHIPLIDSLWKDRGEIEKRPVFVHPVERAGLSVSEKLERIRAKMEELNATGHIVSALDDVAWTLNLRGSDVACNPVFLSYLYLSKNEAILFVDIEKLNEDAKQLMCSEGVKMQEYNTFFSFLSQLNNEFLWIPPTCNQAVFETVKDKNSILKRPAPGQLMKAIKTKQELDGFRSAMITDGVAMVKFLYWLTHNVGKISMDEFTIGEELEKFRRKGENFVGISFDSIVGYQGNGAIIHYKASKTRSAEVFPYGSILVDSGGQYLQGTTDITRTFPLGEASEEFLHNSTLVLKGMIALAKAIFPKGTKGTQLDILARQPLWNEGKDYNHGTGHGVGCFLNVHEGPQSIRKDFNNIPLEVGMVVSDEPGYYLEGKYGIRHENLVVVKEWKTTEWNTFYAFETLTLCPFFKNGIKKEMLSSDEIQWLNDYHQYCKKKLEPHLSGAVKEWFLDLVNPI